jgi:hypothetical protein
MITICERATTNSILLEGASSRSHYRLSYIISTMDDLIAPWPTFFFRQPVKHLTHKIKKQLFIFLFKGLDRSRELCYSELDPCTRTRLERSQLASLLLKISQLTFRTEKRSIKILSRGLTEFAFCIQEWFTPFNLTPAFLAFNYLPRRRSE